MIVSVVSAALNSYVLKKSNIKTKKEVFGFNFIGSFIWLILLLTATGGFSHMNPKTWIWGCFYGLIQALFILFKTVAMRTGAISVTTLIGNSSLLISVLVSLLVWKEPIGGWDIFGLFLLGISIFCCTYKNTTTKNEPSWKIYVIFFLVFASAVGLVFKAFGKSEVSQSINDMMVVSAMCMLLFFAVAYLVSRDETEYRTSKPTKTFFVTAVASGILSCLYNRLNIYLSAKLPAVIFFPFFNGSVILLSTLAGMYLCKEKLTKRQFLGIFLGIASICIIGIL